MKPFAVTPSDIGSGLLLIFLSLVFSAVLNSPSFSLKKVEFSGTNSGDLGYIDNRVQKIENQLDTLEKGANLVTLGLGRVESLLAGQDWIRSFRAKKRLPDTLEVAVVGRERVAVLQTESGGLKYVDPDGIAFGEMDWMVANEFVLLTGFRPDAPWKIRKALEAVKKIQTSELSRLLQVLRISVTSEDRYELEAVSSPRGDGGESVFSVELGQDLDDLSLAVMKNLALVLKYTYQRKIGVFRISLSQDKKIIVKTKSDS